MSKPLKICVLDINDSTKFKQLSELYIEFLINIFIRNKPKYADLEISKQYEIVKKAIQEYKGEKKLEVLTYQNIQDINDAINSSIMSAKKSKYKKRLHPDTISRYYILTDKNRVVGFQKAEIDFDDEYDITEGWRTEAYTKPEYASILGDVIDSNNKLHTNTYYSKVIYDDISNWFKENGVTTEKTSTGVNMFQNIYAYIMILGFLPYDIDSDSTYIFLQKDLKHNPIKKSILKKIYHLYCDYRLQAKQNRSQILSELDEIPELNELTDEQKRDLATCFFNPNNPTNHFLTNEIGISVNSIPLKKISESSSRVAHDMSSIISKDNSK